MVCSESSLPCPHGLGDGTKEPTNPFRKHPVQHFKRKSSLKTCRPWSGWNTVKRGPPDLRTNRISQIRHAQCKAPHSCGSPALTKLTALLPVLVSGQMFESLKASKEGAALAVGPISADLARGQHVSPAPRAGAELAPEASRGGRRAWAVLTAPAGTHPCCGRTCRPLSRDRGGQASGVGTRGAGAPRPGSPCRQTGAVAAAPRSDQA